MIRTEQVCIRVLPFTIGDNEYDLWDFEFEADYEIEGEDVRPTYWDPGDRATWILHDLRFADQDQIDHYNAEASEWDGEMPWEEGDSIYKHLSPENIAYIERELEEADRTAEMERFYD